jgi:hypothetical protein
VPGQRRERRVGKELERLDRLGEGVRHQALGLFLEAPIVDLADLVARREHPVRAGDDHAAGLVLRGELAQRRRDGVEDRLVESVALGRICDGQARDVLEGAVHEQLARG